MRARPGSVPRECSHKQFTIGSSATTSAHRFFYNSSNGGLFFDVDGNGATAAVQFATLNTGLALTNADIVTIDTNGNNRIALVDDNGVHGGQLNWGTDGKIYYHSIYLFLTNFTAHDWAGLFSVICLLFSRSNSIPSIYFIF